MKVKGWRLNWRLLETLNENCIECKNSSVSSRSPDSLGKDSCTKLIPGPTFTTTHTRDAEQRRFKELGHEPTQARTGLSGEVLAQSRVEATCRDLQAF